MNIFAGWADNGLSSCIWVVGANARKWGCLGGVSVHGPVCLRGWWDQSKDFGKSVAFEINRTDDEYEAIRARHVFDCGIFLDGEVDNMV